MKTFIFKALAMFPLLIAGAGCSDDKTADDGPVGSDPALELVAGTPTQTSVSVLLSATDAEQMAYLIEEKSEETVVLTAEEIFEKGIILNASTEPVAIEEKELQPGTTFFVQAAARSKSLYSTPQTLIVSTPEIPRLIYFDSSSKTGFSYRIDNIASDQIVFHSYLEKWAYDDLVSQYQEAMGEDFDLNLMLTDFLADYGFEATGPQTITWNAGDENLPRGGIATIVGGKDYYAVACTVDVETVTWGKPETVAFKTEDPAESTANIEIYIDQLTPEQMLSRIEPDNTILYYFYFLINKPEADAFKEQLGQKAFENQVYENGYIAENEYTDRWEFTIPKVDYILAVFGVDQNGDTMYAEKVIERPEYQPDFVISMQPYENELQGFYNYQSIEVSVAPSYFAESPADQMLWALTPQEVIDATLEMADGATLEECVAGGYIMTYPLAEEWSEALISKGFFTEYFNDLEPGTEYCFIVAAPDPKNPEQLMVRYATATTEAMPDVSNPDPEYLAYLGTWNLTGKSTSDWSTPLSYDITIEQLTPNRSFKVSGWSKSNIGKEFPFVMNYDPATKKHFVKAPQSLGTYTQDGMELEVTFAGMFINGFTDDLSIYIAPTYTAYTGRITDNRMSFLSELFKIDGSDKEFMSLGYVGRSSDNQFYAFTDDEYNPVYFSVTRSAASAAPVRPLAGIGGKRSFTCDWFAPQTEVRIPLRPTVVQPQTIPASDRSVRTAVTEKMRSNPRYVSKWYKAQPLHVVPHVE